MLTGNSLFDTSTMYMVADRRVLCDISREDKLLDGLLLLFCVHYTYNYDCKLQKNAMLFVEKATFGADFHTKMPISVMQVLKSWDISLVYIAWTWLNVSCTYST